jgi:hypothetical protein
VKDSVGARDNREDVGERPYIQPVELDPASHFREVLFFAGKQVVDDDDPPTVSVEQCPNQGGADEARAAGHYMPFHAFRLPASAWIYRRESPAILSVPWGEVKTSSEIQPP